MAYAAHLHHRVAHQSRTWETILGFGGLVAGVAVASYAGGLAAAPALFTGASGVGLVAATALFAMAVANVCGIISDFTDFGRMIGRDQDLGVTAMEGAVVSAARTVFVGPNRLPAANATKTTQVDCHDGNHVSQGSETVHIEGHNASRKGDGTSCGGVIAEGCTSVEVGGRAVGDTGQEQGDFWFRLLVDTQAPFDFVATWVPGGKSLKDIGSWILGMVAEITGDQATKNGLATFGTADATNDALNKRKARRK